MRQSLAVPISMLLLTCSAILSAAERPNIVLILSDDMGWNQVGFNGGNTIPTPNIDSLARDGCTLTNFYAQSVCSPTRAALLTGRYPFRNGMEERTHGNDVAGMLIDERTLAQALREAGYFTAIVGKWHLGSWFKKHLPMQRGFDYQYGHYGAVIDYFYHTRAQSFDWHRNEEVLLEEGYSTFLIAEEFVRVLGRVEQKKPFFIYVPFNAVHGPNQAPEEYVKKKYEGVGGNPRLAKQYAQVECMDVAVGKILKAIDDEDYRENTLVLFLNDNGGTKLTGNAPLRGAKGSYYEGGLKVPCVLRWPGKIKPGSKSNALMHVVDIYPTLLNLADVSLKQPLPIDGLDMWKSIVAGISSPRREIVFNLPGAPRSNIPAIRQDDFKLVGRELFNLREDPYEKVDLAAKAPEVVARLQGRMNELLSQRRKAEEHSKIPVQNIMLGELENAKLKEKQIASIKKILQMAAQVADPQKVNKPPTEKAGAGNPDGTRIISAATLRRRDRNGDGELTLEEFIANPKNRNVSALTRQFQAIDQDGNERLSEDELLSKSRGKGKKTDQ